MMQETRNKRVRWGFIWAILCAAFWGIGYVALDVQWMVPPFADNAGLTENGHLICSIFMAATQALVYTVVLFLVWAGVTGKIRDVGRTIAHTRFDRSIVLGAFFGGPCAVFGTCLAIGYIGASFASAMAMMSSVTGVALGVLVYKEKIDRRLVAGVVLILLGGMLILNPSQMLQDLSSPESPDGIALGYLGGVLAAIGWGVEGAFLTKVLDVTDADSVIPVRYALESVIWVAVILPLTCLWLGADVFADVAVKVFTSLDFIAWEVIACFWIGFCYAFMYKCYPLLGVGRTMTSLSLNVLFAFLATYIFLGQVTGWWIVVGAIVAILGKMVMYSERSAIADSNRNNGGAGQ